MSKAGGRRWTCKATRKHRFRDQREAVKALQRAVTARRFAREDGLDTRRREVRAYACDRCKGWHLTSWADASGPGGSSVAADAYQLVA